MKVAITVKDSMGGGMINSLASWDVKVIDLLESGYAFKGENNTWYDSTHNESETTVTNVEVKATLSVTIKANKESCTYGYNAENAPILTANTDGNTATYQWFVDETEQNGETGSIFTFPIGKSVNTYTVKLRGQCDWLWRGQR